LSESTLIIVPLVRADPPLVGQVEEVARAGASAVELRVDLIRDIESVSDFLAAGPELPTILTVRSEDEGGERLGDSQERIALAARLGRLNPTYIDVELATWEGSEEVRRRMDALCASDENTGRPTLILSHHDLRRTPNKLGDTFDRLAASPAGVIKAVFTPRDALDSCRVLAELRRLGCGRRVIALALGEAGLLTRVLGRKFGAWATFAAGERGGESAAGQPTITELRDLFGWVGIDADTRAYGVIGWPVTHSLSPRFHNEYMRGAGINGVYSPTPITPTYAAFAAFMDYTVANPWLDFHGFSVTIPHKQHALRWLSETGGTISEVARRCGAVNTLIRNDNGKWRGENTDAAGVVRALSSVTDIREKGLGAFSVDVLGAGGAARAAVAVLVEHGGRVTIHNRDEERARELARQFGCESATWEQRVRGAGDILVNCTSVGMAPDVDRSPMPAERFTSGPIVFDTIYNPAETRLLREARERGCRTISGMDMFAAQANEQISLWHGSSGRTPCRP